MEECGRSGAVQGPAGSKSGKTNHQTNENLVGDVMGATGLAGVVSRVAGVAGDVINQTRAWKGPPVCHWPGWGRRQPDQGLERPTCLSLAWLGTSSTGTGPGKAHLSVTGLAGDVGLERPACLSLAWLGTSSTGPGPGKAHLPVTGLAGDVINRTRSWKGPPVCHWPGWGRRQSDQGLERPACL
eukprot:365398-Chlamydomonas_euryale.AAC.5